MHIEIEERILDIDVWPLIPAYLEIEGNTIEEVKKIEELLDVDKEKKQH